MFRIYFIKKKFLKNNIFQSKRINSILSIGRALLINTHQKMWEPLLPLRRVERCLSRARPPPILRFSRASDPTTTGYRKSGWFFKYIIKIKNRLFKTLFRLLLDQHPKHNPIFRIGPPSLDCESNTSGRSERPAFAKTSSIDSSVLSCDESVGRQEVTTDHDDRPVSSVLFPSMRLLLAVLLCCCYITISISSSNIAVALICMIKCPIHGYTGDLEWQSDQVCVLFWGWLALGWADGHTRKSHPKFLIEL